MPTETFSNDVKSGVMFAQNGYCRAEGCLERIHSIHHKLQNTKPNNKKFPIFINSPMNAVGLCHFHHDNIPHVFRITPEEAVIYEAFLEGFIDGNNS